MSCCALITALVIIAIIILVSLLIVYNNKTIQPFSQTLGYANNEDPYDEPTILENVISPEYANSIIEYSRDKLVDSEVVGGKAKSVRNSQQTWISKNDELVKPIFDAICNMYNIPFENAEDLQVVRYLPGQYYNEHHDSCCDDNDKCREFVKRGGQRKLTILIYLNNDFEEGSTYFRNLDLKVKPNVGDAVVFYPLAKNSNRCHPKALHQGMSVVSGEKWVCNLWYRQNAFH